MALDSIAGRLLGLDIFRGLEASHVERIAQDAERLIFRDRQKIIEAGEACDGAIVIISGEARALAQEERDLDEFTVEPGSMLGETAMLTEHTAVLTIVADGDVRAIKVNRDALRRHLEDEPSLAQHFQERLADRLQRTAIELRMIDERLAVASLVLAESESA